jgi:hypothetical protein
MVSANFVDAVAYYTLQTYLQCVCVCVESRKQGKCVRCTKRNESTSEIRRVMLVKYFLGESFHIWGSATPRSFYSRQLRQWNEEGEMKVEWSVLISSLHGPQSCNKEVFPKRTKKSTQKEYKKALLNIPLHPKPLSSLACKCTPLSSGNRSLSLSQDGVLFCTRPDGKGERSVQHHCV